MKWKVHFNEFLQPNKSPAPRKKMEMKSHVSKCIFKSLYNNMKKKKKEQ